MNLQYIITERIYDSYLDLLHYEFNSLSEEISENIPVSIVLIRDILVRIWTANTYFVTKTKTIYKDIVISFAKESPIIDKNVLGIGCDDFFRYYFIGTDDYKKMLKKEVNFDLFFWIMHLNNETIYSDEYKKIVSYSEFLQNISISEQKIESGMVMKREGQNYILKKYDIDALILKFKKQLNETKTHI